LLAAPDWRAGAVGAIPDGLVNWVERRILTTAVIVPVRNIDVARDCGSLRVEVCAAIHAMPRHNY